MHLKPHAPYILALALAGLSGGVLAAVAGDSAGLGAGQNASIPPALSPMPETVPSAQPSAPAQGAVPTPPSASAGAAQNPLQGAELLPPVAEPAPYRWFPSLLCPQTAATAARGPADIPEEQEMTEADDPFTNRIPVLANNMVLAFYGQPNSKRMGILGEYSKEDLARLLKGYERLYEEAGGGAVVGAYYLIYGTCWPEGEIGYLKDSVVRDYIEYARQQGMLVFIDHQIGKYPVADAMKRLLPYLKYPNVHLALDPEWRTTAPMKEVGTITADELNDAEAMIEAYLDKERIPGVKMLVVHQFNERMIEGRGKVRANFERVQLVHTADGFGPPALKRSAYAFNALAANMPLKGFKLFFKTTVPGAGFDDPLLTPSEVLALQPTPRVVIYQ